MNPETQDPGPLPSVGEMLAETKSASACAFYPDAVAGQVITMAEAADMVFDDGPGYDRGRVVEECRFYMGQSAEAMLEAGKRLMALKDHEEHGDFLRIVETDLNLNPRTAQLMMTAAAKFLGPALAGPKAKTFSLLGKSKLFELMTEDDGELAELAEGGEIAGLNLDDIQRMTVRELKAALREAKAQAEAKTAELQAQLEAAREVAGKQRERMDGRIQELEEKLELRRKTPPLPDERAARLRGEIGNLSLAITGQIGAGFRNLAQTLADLGPEEFSKHTDFLAALLCEQEAAINAIRNDFGLPRTVDGSGIHEAYRQG